MLELEAVKIKKPQDCNVIIGQAHFIKTVEDLYEALVSSMPKIKFGFAFCESSGECLIRAEGTDNDLKQIAIDNALAVGAGHSFFVFIKEAYPINVLAAIKNLNEVCNIFCATANAVEVIIVKSQQGRGILGVVDGFSPRGVENEEGIKWRRDFLRKIGYKLNA